MSCDRRVGLAALVFGLVVAGVGLVLYGGDASRMVFAGDINVDSSAAPDALTVVEGAGYDGQFYYRQALAPISNADRVAGIRFDEPALRSQRILYPLLAGSAGAFQPAAVIYTMVIINVLAFGFLGCAASRRAQQLGRSPWVGLVLVAAPALVLAQLWDLGEVVAAGLLLWGLVALAERRVGAAAAFLTLAMFTRETTLIVPIAGCVVVGWHYVRSRRLDPSWWAYVVPLGAALVWQVVLGWRFGELPFTASASLNIGLPFSGLVQSIGDALDSGAGRDLAAVLTAVLLWVLLAMFARSLGRTRASTVERTAFVLGAVLVSLLTPFFWLGAQHFLRAFSEVYLLGLIIVMGDAAVGAPAGDTAKADANR